MLGLAVFYEFDFTILWEIHAAFRSQIVLNPSRLGFSYRRERSYKEETKSFTCLLIQTIKTLCFQILLKIDFCLLFYGDLMCPSHFRLSIVTSKFWDQKFKIVQPTLASGRWLGVSLKNCHAVQDRWLGGNLKTLVLVFVLVEVVTDIIIIIVIDDRA